MFSVRAATPMTLTLGCSLATAFIVAITAAAPDMSYFMCSIPWAVFKDNPPESKVMPLPTIAMVFLALAALCLITRNLGGSLAPLATPTKQPISSFSIWAMFIVVTERAPCLAIRCASCDRRAGVMKADGSLMRSLARFVLSAIVLPARTLPLNSREFKVIPPMVTCVRDDLAISSLAVLYLEKTYDPRSQPST